MSTRKGMRTISKGVIIGIAIIIIVIGISVYIATRKPSSMSTALNTSSSYKSFSAITTSSSALAAGSSVNFYLPSFPTNAKYALVYFGDGNIKNISSQYTSYVYKYPGRYMIMYNFYTNKGSLIGGSSQSLIELTVSPNVSLELAPLISVPTITFNSTENPTAPLFNVSQKIYL
ncbi:MAG: ABC transporter substrate-binding protein, partial [Caldisphaera sp.]